MSVLPTLEDGDRAKLAAAHVEAIPPGDQPTDPFPKYRSQVLSLPALIQAQGLAVALHFVAARRDAGQRLILDHLAAQLRRDPAAWHGQPGEAPRDAQAVLALTRTASLDRAQALTREVQRCLAWYKRMIQGRSALLPRRS